MSTQSRAVSRVANEASVQRSTVDASWSRGDDADRPDSPGNAASRLRARPAAFSWAAYWLLVLGWTAVFMVMLNVLLGS